MWVVFRIWGGRGNGGLAHSEKTHCRAFGSLFDRVAWDTEQWIELIRFTIFAQRRREGGRNSEHSGCPSIPQLCKGDSDARFSCKLPSAGNRVIYCICRAAPTSRYSSGEPFIFTITTYICNRSVSTPWVLFVILLYVYLYVCGINL